MTPPADPEKLTVHLGHGKTKAQEEKEKGDRKAADDAAKDAEVVALVAALPEEDLSVRRALEALRDGGWSGDEKHVRAAVKKEEARRKGWVGVVYHTTPWRTVRGVVAWWGALCPSHVPRTGGLYENIEQGEAYHTVGLGSRAWTRQVGACLATYGDRCWLCGRGGADSADYVVPRRLGGDNSLGNLRPVHHGPCPVCQLRCNIVRGVKPMTPQLRKWFVRRTRNVTDERSFFDQKEASDDNDEVLR